MCGKVCSDPKDLSKHILECNQTSCKKSVDGQLSTSASSKPTNKKPVKKQGCQTKDEFDRAEKKREEKNQRKRERYAKRRNERDSKKIDSISVNSNELKDFPLIDEEVQQIPIEPKMETEDFFLSNSCDVKKMNRKRGCSTEEKSEDKVQSKRPANDTDGTSEETEGASKEAVEEFSCNLCSKVFKYKRALSCHVLSCGPKFRPFSCHLCQDVFRTQKTLDYHIECQHKIIKCQYPNCNFEGIKDDLRKHVDRKHLKNREFKCDHCDYAATRSDHLRRHIEVHTNEKRFKCQWCDYRSNQKHNTLNHEKLYCKYRKVAI